MRFTFVSASLAVALVCVQPAGAETAGARLVAECDRLAASDLDPNRPQGVRGVPFAAINVKAALAACSSALKVDAAEPRILFQTGRVLIVAKRYADARSAFRLSHKTGYLIATESLAIMLRDGLGASPDPEAARALLDEAAASGRPFAMRLLGTMFANGLGGPKNPDEARQLFVDAMQGLSRYAAAGSTTAMCVIASMHENGDGVPADPAEAERWRAKVQGGKAVCTASMP